MPDSDRADDIAPTDARAPPTPARADPGAAVSRTRRRHSRGDWALLLALTVTWGSAFMLTKVALAGVTTERLVAGRLLVACLILIPVAWRFAERPPLTPRLWLFHALMALFGYALPLALIAWGQTRIDSGLAGILMAVMPLATLGLAHALIPDERLTPYRVGGFLLGFAGILVLMGPSAWSGVGRGGGQLLPMLAVLAGAFSYAVSAILARLRPRSDALFSAALTISLALLMTLPGALPGGPPPYPGDRALTALLLLGVFSTALAAILYFGLVKRAGPTFVSQLNYLIPLWAVGCGLLFLDERLQSNQLYALGLVLGGILVSHLERARQ